MKYSPGFAGVAEAVGALHRAYYEPTWAFVPGFADGVRAGMDRALAAYDSARFGFWLAYANERIVGAIGITPEDRVADGSAARLRYFVLAEEARGRGLGRALMNEAMAFVRAAGYARVSLFTFVGLEAARRLYERAGFRITSERDVDLWGPTVRYLEYELVLDAPRPEESPRTVEGDEESSTRESASRP